MHPSEEAGGNAARPRIFLLRHGHVDSHRGDVPLSANGAAQAREAGAVLAGQIGSARSVLLLSGGTRRTRETAEGVRSGLQSAMPVTAVPVIGEPRYAVALRNPDLYLGGVRVDLVSSAEAFRDQVPGLTGEDVVRNPFYRGFLQAPDRITWWLGAERPPGDDAPAVARRIAAFVGSFADLALGSDDVVIGVTHSPVLRAVGLHITGTDGGEPPYLSGFEVHMDESAALAGSRVDPLN